MKNKHLYFLSLAAREALKGIKKKEGGPFGAVIVKNGKIIAQAHNTVLKTQDPTRHAEINALQQASHRLKSFNLKGTTIYSTTEPCPMCFAAIHWARIGGLVFGTSISDVKKLGFNEMAISNKTLKKLAKSRLNIKKLSHPECRELLVTWRRLPGQKTY